MKKPFRLKKRGKVYYFRLPWETCFHSTGCTRQREAEHYALERLKEGPETSKKILFKDFTETFFVWGECRWIEANHDKGRPFSKQTASWRRGHVTNYLIPKLGERLLSEISPNIIDELLLNLKLENSTKNKVLDTASIIFDMACKESIITKSPTEQITRFSENAKHKDIFDIEELNILFPDNTEELIRIWGSLTNAAFFTTLAHTGMRAGECRVLEWKDVLLDKNLILINKALKNDGSIGKTKNGKDREAFITNKLKRILIKQKNGNEEESPYVFPKMMTNLNDRNLYGKIHKAALKSSGIEMNGRYLPPHSFRHTFNTILRNELGDDSAVRKLLGHQSPEMTEIYYNPSIVETSRLLRKHSQEINEIFH